MNIGKNYFWVVLIILTLLLACSPIEVSAQSPSNEQRLVGSWTNLHNNSAVVFNADGTATGIPNADGNAFNQWAAAGNVIILFGTGHNLRALVVFDISSVWKDINFHPSELGCS